MFPANREYWKRIDGYANYEVSNFGRVCNATTERILKPRDRSGYHAVALSKNGKAKNHNIHKLVAHEWLDNPDGKRCVDHVDGNKKIIMSKTCGMPHTPKTTKTERIEQIQFQCIRGYVFIN